MNTDELARMVNEGDKAQAALAASLIPIAERIAARTCSKYPWISKDDLNSTLLASIPRIIRSYKQEKAPDFAKYAYHRLYFEAKDCLRENDPLGISWPQKSKENYPAFSRLGDESFEDWSPADPHEEELDEELDEVSEMLMQIYKIKDWLKSLDCEGKPPSPLPRPKKHKVRKRMKFELYARPRAKQYIKRRKLSKKAKQLEFDLS